MKDKEYQPSTEFGAVVMKAGEGLAGCFTCAVIIISSLLILLALATGYIVHIRKGV